VVSAEPTIGVVIREQPQKLEAIRARSKRCGMSTSDFYRYGADLALQFTEADFVRVAAERMARGQGVRP
jgi:hypothetical protein